MTQKNFVALSEIKQKIIHFKQEIGWLTQENAEDFRKRLQDIKDDMQLVLLESTDRQEERVERREKINKHIEKENREWPKKAIERYFKENTQDALERLSKKWLRFDDAGNIQFGKLKNPKKIANVIPVDFTPTPLRKGDHYLSVRQKLEHREQEIINELTSLLELAEEKSRNMYEYYTNPSELFEKLGLSIKKVDYAFFAKELNKTPLPRVWGDQDIVKKWPWEIPNFKKIWAFMKYVIENNILFRASNIVTDNNQWYQFYFYDRDVTVLISDEITGNCFRDATYVIKGMLPGLRNFKKEEFKKYQGKKIIFNDQWCKRLGSVFTENPDHWTNIWEEKDDQPEVTRTLLTDRIKCIELLKDNFTPETFNTSSYKAFARAYNAQQNNEFFLNETINGLVSLFGIWGKVTMEVIKDAIFESKKPKLQIPEDAYLYTKNQHIKNMLVAMSKCEEFDPETVLGSVNYDRWVKELTRKAYGAEFVDDVANKSPKEKKEKLEIYTGIKGFPLYARKLTSMLGGRVRSLDAVYQKMLWKKFIMHMDNKSTLQEYKDLQHEILTYETNWEDGKIKPNVNKSEHKGRKKGGTDSSKSRNTKVQGEHTNTDKGYIERSSDDRKFPAF